MEPTTHWLTHDGRTVALADMQDMHIVSVLRFLQAKIDRFHDTSVPDQAGRTYDWYINWFDAMTQEAKHRGITSGDGHYTLDIEADIVFSHATKATIVSPMTNKHYVAYGDNEDEAERKIRLLLLKEANRLNIELS